MATSFPAAVKRGIIEEHRRHEKDAGSAEVQVAVLTRRISYLTEHLSKHKKDHATRRGLLMMVGRRHRLLRYLRTRDTDRYQNLIQALGLRK